MVSTVSYQTYKGEQGSAHRFSYLPWLEHHLRSRTVQGTPFALHIHPSRLSRSALMRQSAACSSMSEGLTQSGKIYRTWEEGFRIAVFWCVLPVRGFLFFVTSATG